MKDQQRRKQKMKNKELVNELENAYRMSLRTAIKTNSRKAWMAAQSIARAYEILVNGFEYKEERYKHTLEKIEEEELDKND
jgi:ribosomal protein S19